MSTIRIAIFASSAVAITLLGGAVLTSRSETTQPSGERAESRAKQRMMPDQIDSMQREPHHKTRAISGATLGSERGVLPSAPAEEVPENEQRILHLASRTARMGDFCSYTIEQPAARAATQHSECRTDLDPSDFAALSDLLAGTTSELSEAWSTPEGDVIALALDNMGNLSVVVVEPPRTPADMNKDARIDNDDLSVFMRAMQAGDPRADIDGNGILDIFDIQTFTRHLGEGEK